MRHTRRTLRQQFARLLAGLAGLCLVFAGVASAEETGRFALSGLGTLGLARSDTDTAEFVRDFLNRAA